MHFASYYWEGVVLQLRKRRKGHYQLAVVPTTEKKESCKSVVVAVRRS